MAAEEQVNGVPTSALSAGRRRRVNMTLVVAAVWAAALTGGVLGVVALIGNHAPSPSPHPLAQRAHAPGPGDRVLTSFGSFSMNSVQTLVGPQRAMHLTVPRGLQPIQVMVTVNNLQHRPLTVQSGWFRLVDASGSFPVGYASPIHRLAALSTRGILLRFAVPPGARLPRLEYRDPAGRAPVLVTLPSAEVLQTFNPATHQHGG
jgi:hypothetical protein